MVSLLLEGPLPELTLRDDAAPRALLRVEQAKGALSVEEARAREVTAQWGPQLQVSLQGGREAPSQWFGNFGLGLTLPVFESAEGARAAAEDAGVWLEVECERPAEARFNATAMRQALDNLLSNALRFAPKGTAIQLTLRRHGAGWRLSVRDRGPGIPESQREAVFAPFHRGDARGGSGLGLAIVSEVTRLHGGRAFATSRDDGSGAQVVLELP